MCTRDASRSMYLRLFSFEGGQTLADLQANGIPAYCDDTVIPVEIAFFTTWNDASGQDGAIALQTFVTGDSGAEWYIDDVFQNAGPALLVAADEGVLDGTLKKVSIQVIDPSALNGLEIQNAKIEGILDLTLLAGSVFNGSLDLNWFNNAITQFIGSDITIETASRRFNCAANLSFVGVLDLTMITFDNSIFYCEQIGADNILFNQGNTVWVNEFIYRGSPLRPNFRFYRSRVYYYKPMVRGIMSQFAKLSI